MRMKEVPAKAFEWLVGKGQLISKGLFDVFNSSKKRTKTHRIEVHTIVL